MASLGKDLAHIRKERKISLDDIHQTTKIPEHIIHSIEDGSIFTDFEENATYIRSYIRSYAKAISIEERDIIYALNKREKNDYSGSLQKLFQMDPKQPYEDEVAQTEPPNKKEDEEELKESSEDATKVTADKSEPEPVPPSQPGSTTEKPGVRSVDWADMGRRFQPLKSAHSRARGFAVLFVLILGSAFIYYFYFSGSGSESAQRQTSGPRASQPVSTDSLELDIVSPVGSDTAGISTLATSDGQSQTLTSLPDTLDIIVYAAYGKLEPVRVYTDIMNNINPYWIEKGEALKFNFVNEIRVRGQFSRMALLMNGHIVQNIREEFYNPETRLLEINRSFFEGDSKWLQPAPDSLQIDAPPPTIKERPTFN